MIEIYSLFLIVQKIFRCINASHLIQFSPSIYFLGQLMNPSWKRWSWTLCHEKKWNQAPELYEIGVESPTVGIAAKDEGDGGNNWNCKDGDEQIGHVHGQDDIGRG
jgi:hypothetical protein